MNRRSGFTLVECMVAALLLAGGLLALTASGRAMQQLDLLGGRIAAAADVAASRIAGLRANPCAGPVSGSAAGPVFAEQWSVGATGLLRSASVDVSFMAAGRSRTVRYQAAWLCGRP